MSAYSDILKQRPELATKQSIKEPAQNVPSPKAKPVKKKKGKKK